MFYWVDLLFYFVLFSFSFLNLLLSTPVVDNFAGTGFH